MSEIVEIKAREIRDRSAILLDRVNRFGLRRGRPDADADDEDAGDMVSERGNGQ